MSQTWLCLRACRSGYRTRSRKIWSTMAVSCRRLWVKKKKQQLKEKSGNMASAVRDDITNQFARVNSDSYTEYGLEKGETVFIAGNGFSPTDELDLYKLLFVVVKLKD